ncbi:hypothetical protein HPB47_004978 [Ixodes persulcatus]|uniref:Uncharacterized protein n=1 Tax=Ixodes persulcatus TaxID=34615 RepID=A0AC60PF63_IXOPE|nr:hypothetical protein HPB47_004978 [Ixodes persulcatus]
MAGFRIPAITFGDIAVPEAQLKHVDTKQKSIYAQELAVMVFGTEALPSCCLTGSSMKGKLPKEGVKGLIVAAACLVSSGIWVRVEPPLRSSVTTRRDPEKRTGTVKQPPPNFVATHYAKDGRHRGRVDPGVYDSTVGGLATLPPCSSSAAGGVERCATLWRHGPGPGEVPCPPSPQFLLQPRLQFLPLPRQPQPLPLQSCLQLRLQFLQRSWSLCPRRISRSHQSPWVKIRPPPDKTVARIEPGYCQSA